MKTHPRFQAHELDQSNEPATLAELCEKAALIMKTEHGLLGEDDFDIHPFVDGMTHLIFEIQKQAWHEWDDDVALNWIRFEIKERVYG